ncbi:CBS domain-containing protein [Streptomyces sp. NPDC048663]|uniref:CBS domain-containing protein n=1 Tax=Streptomyces sp. NPDC048663 TaxID=3155638 RepID=UPI003434667B
MDAVMPTRVVTVGADDDLRAAYRALRRAGVRRLPVVRVRGRDVVGALTAEDLFPDVFRRPADLFDPAPWNGVQEPLGPASGASYET